MGRWSEEVSRGRCNFDDEKRCNARSCDECFHDELLYSMVEREAYRRGYEAGRNERDKQV